MGWDCGQDDLEDLSLDRCKTFACKVANLAITRDQQFLLIQSAIGRYDQFVYRVNLVCLGLKVDHQSITGGLVNVFELKVFP